LLVTGDNLCIPTGCFEHVIYREVGKGHSRGQRQTGLITLAEFNLGAVLLVA
jgi:hypothetical protein